MEIPVYLFSGFMDSGKSSLIKETLIDGDFGEGGKTLLILCEDGEVEFEEEELAKAHACMAVIDKEESLTAKTLKELKLLHQPDQVFVEYNGTWQMSTFLELELPQGWVLVQSLATVDATTFEMYLNNMRAMIMEQIFAADVVIINFPDVVYANSERDKDDIDSIHIYLLTKDGAEIKPDLLAEINDFFDENGGGRKVVGANKIFVEPATLVPLKLEADLIVKDRYSRAEVKSNIEELITNYFEVGNYPFAQELSLSELATEVQMPENAILGIKSFKFMFPEEPVLKPKPNEIYTLESLEITAVGGVA